jgi:hypothetical protein
MDSLLLQDWMRDDLCWTSRKNRSASVATLEKEDLPLGRRFTFRKKIYL